MTRGDRSRLNIKTRRLERAEGVWVSAPTATPLISRHRFYSCHQHDDCPAKQQMW